MTRRSTQASDAPTQKDGDATAERLAAQDGEPDLDTLWAAQNARNWSASARCRSATAFTHNRGQTFVSKTARRYRHDRSATCSYRLRGSAGVVGARTSETERSSEASE